MIWMKTFQNRNFINIRVSFALVNLENTRNILGYVIGAIYVIVRSWDGNAFHIVGPLWGESLLQRDSYVTLWRFLYC